MCLFIEDKFFLAAHTIFSLKFSLLKFSFPSHYTFNSKHVFSFACLKTYIKPLNEFQQRCILPVKFFGSLWHSISTLTSVKYKDTLLELDSSECFAITKFYCTLDSSPSGSHSRSIKLFMECIFYSGAHLASWEIYLVIKQTETSRHFGLTQDCILTMPFYWYIFNYFASLSPHPCLCPPTPSPFTVHKADFS